MIIEKGKNTSRFEIKKKIELNKKVKLS